MPEMQHIRLSLEEIHFDNNELSDSVVDIQDGYPKLKYISLHQNNLTYVPDFGQLVEHLEYVILSHNCIESLHSIYNVRYIKLRSLNLKKNRIKHISLSSVNMPMIHNLDIADNLLETLEPIENVLSKGPKGNVANW